jgi:hypothetical protein
VAACGTTAADTEAAPASAIVGRAAAGRDVTIPAGTLLHLTLSTSVASDTSQVEDAVAAELTNAVMVGDRTALPSGALVAGTVRSVDPSGRVKGRARLALDFTSVTSDGRRYAMSADQFSRQASATKGEDATKIGIGAGAGAVIGGLLGGRRRRHRSGPGHQRQGSAPPERDGCLDTADGAADRARRQVTS